MNNKQGLVYGLLASTRGLRSIFVGHIHLKKLMKFRKFTEIFHYCLTRLRNIKKIVLIIFIDKNHFKKGKFGAT